jgi:hypothetical protein
MTELRKEVAEQMAKHRKQHSIKVAEARLRIVDVATELLDLYKEDIKEAASKGYTSLTITPFPWRWRAFCLESEFSILYSLIFCYNSQEVVTVDGFRFRCIFISGTKVSWCG